MKKILGMVAIAGLMACDSSPFPITDPNARHLGSTLTVNSCGGGNFSISATWADGSYKAEYLRSGNVVSTVNGVNRVTTSGCVYKLNDKASVRFTPGNVLSQYLDVTTSREITVN